MKSESSEEKHLPGMDSGAIYGPEHLPDFKPVLSAIKQAEKHGSKKKGLRKVWLVSKEFSFWQNGSHFCSNTDTALLAEFMRIHKNENVLEIGCNDAGLMIFADQFHPAWTGGVEILDEPARLAAFNLSEEIQNPWMVFNMDVRKLELSWMPKLDVIICNPPYFEADAVWKEKDESHKKHGRKKGHKDREPMQMDLRQLGRIEMNLNLAELIETAGRLLPSSGRFYLVHRPQRISDIFSLMEENHFGIRRMALAYDRRDSACKSLLVEAVKDRTFKTEIDPPIWIG